MSQIPKAKSKIAIAFPVLSSGGFLKESVPCSIDKSLESEERISDRGGKGKFVCHVLHLIQKKGVLSTSLYGLTVFSIKCSR